jgi:hypothetical protein
MVIGLQPQSVMAIRIVVKDCERTGASEEPLTVALAVVGDLAPRIDPDGSTRPFEFGSSKGPRLYRVLEVHSVAPTLV